MTEKSSMQDLLLRLRKIGFDPNFLRQAVLPDWWEDTLASVPANRALAETAIARHLALDIADLRNAKTALTAPKPARARLKKNKSVDPAHVAPAMYVAQHAAELVARNVIRVPDFTGRRSASQVRQEILKSHAHCDLAPLLEYCWAAGVAVIHVKGLPERSKKIYGMALFCGARPVIVLASAKDSPPWLAFHLAHELGHILLGHVQEGMGPWVDGSIDAKGEDRNETEADEFACEVLTGQKRMSFKPTLGLTAGKVAAAVRTYGEKHRISAGVVTLFYGRSANRWGPAQLALKELSEDHGAHEQIDHALASKLAIDQMPESSARFLSVLNEVA